MNSLTGNVPIISLLILAFFNFFTKTASLLLCLYIRRTIKKFIKQPFGVEFRKKLQGLKNGLGCQLIQSNIPKKCYLSY